jgi:hypothetical protein
MVPEKIKVRLIGIDAPELRQLPWGPRAVAFMRNLVLDKTLLLETDVTQYDKYGRLLAYAWVDVKMANEEIALAGLTVQLTLPPNVKYADRFHRAVSSARKQDVDFGRRAACRNRHRISDIEDIDLISTLQRNTIVTQLYYMRDRMKTIAVKLPEELLAAIQYAAKKRGETNSAVMREALQEFLSKNQHTGSCLDLARDLAGCVEGPPDLSVNPAHMDDYGK